MKLTGFIATIVLALVLVRGWLFPVLIAEFVGLPKGVPVAALAGGKTVPQIGLRGPLPAWMPLPDHGNVLGASVFPSRPHYGSGATVVIKIDGTQNAFVASYEHDLARRGFFLRRITTPVNMIVTSERAQLEADDYKTGRAIFITLLGSYAQLMFWDAPAPHME